MWPKGRISDSELTPGPNNFLYPQCSPPPPPPPPPNSSSLNQSISSPPQAPASSSVKSSSTFPTSTSTPTKPSHSTPISAPFLSPPSSLYSFGLRRSSLGHILDMDPSLFTSDLHLHFYQVLDFLLHEVVIPFPQISKCLYRCPRILVSSVPNQLRPALGFLRSVGFVGPSSIDAHTSLLLVYNVEFILMSKIEYLVGLGFEFDEVKKMVVRSPGLLTLSIDRNLVPKTEYFVKEMRRFEGIEEVPAEFFA